MSKKNLFNYKAIKWNNVIDKNSKIKDGSKYLVY